MYVFKLFAVKELVMYSSVIVALSWIFGCLSHACFTCSQSSHLIRVLFPSASSPNQLSPPRPASPEQRTDGLASQFN